MTTFFFPAFFSVHFEACVNRPRILRSVGLGNRSPPNELSMAIGELRIIPSGQAYSVDCIRSSPKRSCVDSCPYQPKIEVAF